MRTIGKVKLRKLAAIVTEEHDRDPYASHAERDARIRARIPADWFDIWESAWCEIDRVIDDLLMTLIHRR